MGMSGMIDSYKTDSITIIGRGTLADSGAYLYNGASTTTLAWVRDKEGLLRRGEGREFAYSHIAYLGADETVVVGDLIEYRGVRHEVMAIERKHDIEGDADHLRCMLGA